ncbi:hypothetical protein Zmor_016047 [Zophobas morio]|uniref:Mitochondrial uncoupling protein 4 n=1 Tax=Zophobas morio TaxID=2755281 RepID=A0AA38IN84_9CUCU|nr:hypothetical protein Zmor_016047 [Zophobas morio]
MSSNSEKNEKKIVNSLWFIYIVSVASAWNAELITYPLDLVKTRMQIQGELANIKEEKLIKGPYRGFLKTGVGIVSEEGFFKLWQGISAIFVRHLIYSGTRIVVYKSLKEKFFEVGKNDPFPFWKSVTCGVSAGVISQYIASPADLIRVQLQMEGKRRLKGLPPRVHGFYDAYKKTVAAAGYTGLWKGSVPNIQRAAMVTLGDVTVYDVSKRFILEHTSLPDNHVVHTMASVCAGFAAAVLGTPPDVLKTRIMNQPLDEKGRGLLYAGTVDCVKKTVVNEGGMALYKGFVPIWMRLAPWSLVFWLTYEEIVRLLGADQF